VPLNFEFLYGNLTQIVLRPGHEPDQAFDDHLDWVQPGSLNLRDSGYFSLDNLHPIAQTKQAYYLSRLLYGTGLLTPEGQPLKLHHLLKHQPRQPFEMNLLLGVDHKLPARLIAIPLPQAVADRRRQRAKENARRKGRTPSAQYLVTLDWLLFVTKRARGLGVGPGQARCGSRSGKLAQSSGPSSSRYLRLTGTRSQKQAGQPLVGPTPIGRAAPGGQMAQVKP
jgi:hypothetical protein